MKVVLALSLLLNVCACSDNKDDSMLPVDAAGSATDASTSAPDAMTGPLPFMSMCDVANDQCDTVAGDFCFAFNNRGPHCTHSCMDVSMCPEPSRGCNNQGVCKSP